MSSNHRTQAFTLQPLLRIKRFIPVKTLNPPLGSVEFIEVTLVVLSRAALGGAVRVAVAFLLLVVLDLSFSLPRLCLH